MPDYFSIGWDVSIQPEGDVSDDAIEVVLERNEEGNQATVILDTSETPHALEEQYQIQITLDDGNDSVEFTGWVDNVDDDAQKPIVTVDARSATGVMKDTSMVGNVDENTIFELLEGILDEGPSEIREITYDPSPYLAEYGNFQRDVDFGAIDVYKSGDETLYREEFEQREIANEPVEVQIIWDSYENTHQDYVMEIYGETDAGQEVTTEVELPLGSGVNQVFDSRKQRLSFDSADRVVKISGIQTNIPDQLSPGNEVIFRADLFNYVRTDWFWNVGSNSSVYDAVRTLVSYLSATDQQNTWNFYVDDQSGELLLYTGDERQDSSEFTFIEGQNVTKPVVTRNLDGVRNMVKVRGAAGITVWAWAFKGDLRYSTESPFDANTSVSFPDGGTTFASSPQNGVNDIDEINIRAEQLKGARITSVAQAIEIAQRGLQNFIRTAVTGTAPRPGILDVHPGDIAEIYFPSRGIPQKVDDNRYEVQKVAYRVTPNDAKTEVDFGIRRPNVADMIRSGGGIMRTDLDSDINEFAQNTPGGVGGGGSGDDGPFPVVGTLEKQKRDGTWQVKGEDGNLYDNVRVI